MLTGWQLAYPLCTPQFLAPSTWSKEVFHMVRLLRTGGALVAIFIAAALLG